MKIADPGLDYARRKAREVLEELDVRQREQLFDLELLCRQRGALVTYQPLRNLEGMLLSDRRLIVVKDSIQEDGRRRFTVAHELGHWEMHRGLSQLTMCTAENIYAYRGSPAEIEANTFAAALLMPDFMLTEQLKFMSPTLDTIRKLADRFQTSITATAARLCEYTNVPTIVAFSSDGRLRWYRRSAKADPYFFLKIGEELHGESLARYCTSNIDEPSEPVKVDTEAWFPDDFKRDRFEIWEESAELGSYGVTLSVITIDE